MKSIFLVIALMWLIACTPMRTSTSTNSNISSNSNASNHQNTSQVLNNNSSTELLGAHQPSALLVAPYNTWFAPNFQFYKTDSSLITPIKQALKNKHLEIFLGTWCGDSQREVPRMLKILQEAHFDSTHYKLIFVNNTAEAYKQSPQHEEQGKNIVRVPTFIIYKGNTEMGRIIESPIESLEKDLLKILRSEPYQPNYHDRKL